MSTPQGKFKNPRLLACILLTIALLGLYGIAGFAWRVAAGKDAPSLGGAVCSSPVLNTHALALPERICHRVVITISMLLHAVFRLLSTKISIGEETGGRWSQLLVAWRINSLLVPAYSLMQCWMLSVDV